MLGHLSWIVDPRPAIRAELDARLAPLREELGRTEDKDRRKAVRREMRALRREARRKQHSPFMHW